MNETIYALSSGALPAGIAVVRISGSDAEAILMALAGFVPNARRATLATLRAQEGDALDEALVINFPAGSSFTGEPVVELHLHGGRAVVTAVLNEVARHPGTRPAEAGEFTRRAFVNGRMDLTAAEGVADLIASETEAQRRLALRNVSGEQAEFYAGWRARLIEMQALIAADLDFSDEEDVPGSVAASIGAAIRSLKTDIENHLAQARRGEIIRDGYRVVLTGKPNVGKSSLLNAMARRDVAIVSAEAGTTRDLLEVTLDLDGYKVIVTDTAGIRQAETEVERIGIERARGAIRAADLVLRLIEAGTGSMDPIGSGDDNEIVVLTKADLRKSAPPPGGHSVSTITGEGLDTLLRLMASRATKAAGSGGGVLPSHLRQVHLLRSTVGALRRAEATDLPLELQAEELRVASDSLGRITGAIGVEDLLDVVFSRFCIGK